ncbi:B-cell scaffold protein with ankyrin repeats [Sceloporus undulatus]|uniref:B-cell scaffold protein with ankyrin repeats n=1 Tax=Sceloporus undulatus TaxID=8520 RepID=UPI001C4C4DAC|nr:B-cell scaffold protein with ankyrin repeats [Sceloporus undulatus]
MDLKGPPKKRLLPRIYIKYNFILFFVSENTHGILVIYEDDAEEWALYLKSIFKHIVLEDRILLCNLESASLHDLELQSLCSFGCKLLIISSELLNSLNLKKRYFLDQVLQPPEKVVILLCGIENSAIIYQILSIDTNNQLITTDQDPEVYLAVIADIMQQGPHEHLSLDLKSSLKLEDISVETEEILETSERTEVLVLPTRISCESPGEIFILLRDEVPDDSVVVEFITEKKWIRTEPGFWNQKVRCMKALDFPAGIVNVNVYCEGVITATTQIEYYTTVGEIESVLQKVADPIAFACQASRFSSAEKVDSILTFLLKSPIISHGCFRHEDLDCHQQTDLHLEELPSLLHCAAKFGLKNLATLLVQCPEGIPACRMTNIYGENPAQLAEKHGHREIQKIIKELSINEDNKEDNEERDDPEEGEVKAEDDIYVMMMRSESPCNALGKREHPGAFRKIEKNRGMDNEAEQEEDRGERVVEKEASAEEEGNKSEENLHRLGGNDEKHNITTNEVSQSHDRDVNYAERPPLPPRVQPITTRQDEFPYLSPVWETVEDRKVTTEGQGDWKREDRFQKEEEEDPYSSALLDDGVYDMILANAIKERSKGSRSFIMNRPPAPAPRPSCVPVKQENTPYIAQVFQQKANRTHGDEKSLCAAGKTDRTGNDRTTYTTIKPSVPSGQEELILLQEQVKRGIISMDEAVEKFKEWQNQKSGLQVIQKEKTCQLKDSIRKRPEEENIYDQISTVHYPHASMKKGRENVTTEGIVYTTPFGKQTLL